MAVQVQFPKQITATGPTGFSKGLEERLEKHHTVFTSTLVGELHDLAEGYDHPIKWSPVPGVDKVEITHASITIGSAAIGNAENFHISSADQHIDVQVGGDKAVRTLKLKGLKTGSQDLHNTDDLNDAGLKLLVATRDAQGNFAPLYTVPPVAARGVIPATFVGAEYKHKTLHFNRPLQAQDIRVQLVSNIFPSDTNAQAIAVEQVTGTYTSLPLDTQVHLNGDTLLFEFPGAMPLDSPVFQVPFIQQLNNVLQTHLDNGQPMETSLRVQAKPSVSDKAMAQLLIATPRGNLLRQFNGVHTTEVSGETITLNLPLEDALAGEVPSQVHADITVKYRGIRMLTALSDAPPPQPGDLKGQVVRDTPRYKIMPPDALREHALARVGIIGRAPVDAELVLEVVDYTGEMPGQVVRKPDALTLTRDDAIAIHWFTIAEQDPVDHPLALRLRCNRGRFLWLGTDQPQARIAIYDPDPAAEPVTLDGHTLVTGGNLPYSVQGHSLPGHLFRSTPPVLSSPLFLSVEFADLLLRYAR